MAVPSVHNSPTPNTQQQVQTPRNALNHAAGTHNTTQTNATQTTQHTQTQTAQAPKPVVNGQGQKTGQVLNTTA